MILARVKVTTCGRVQVDRQRKESTCLGRVQVFVLGQMAKKRSESYRHGYETRQFFVLIFQSSILLSRGGSFTDDHPDSSRPQTASSSRSDLVYSGRQQKSWKFDGYSSDNDVMPFVHFKAVFTLFRTAFRADNPIQCG